MRESRQLEDLFQHARTLWSADPALATRFGSPASLGYWLWLLESRWARDVVLQRLLPLPPPQLAQRVSGASVTDEFFQRSGIDDAKAFYVQLQRGGFDVTRPARLLDFGCGCGRVLRILARLADTLELHGADVDAPAIAWCRTHLDFAEYEVLPVRPRSPYPDGHFAAVTAYSVFSHLSEELHLAWLAELARITRPGAVLVLTTQGRHCADLLARGTTEFTVPSPAQMQADLPLLGERGFVFYPYPPEFNVSLPDADRDSAVHGMTYILPEYIRERWSGAFEVVAVDEAPRAWQDEVVLRRR